MEEEVEPCFHYQMATLINSMKRELVYGGECTHKNQDGDNKTLLIFILKLNKLHVLLHISTEQLWVNIFCYVISIFCILD